MRFYLFFPVLLLVSFSAIYSQNYDYIFVKDNSCLVKDSLGNNLAFPWAGGMNSCQYGLVDMNMDGVKDLLIFDKIGDRKMCFINTGASGQSSYIYSPEYENLIPKLHSWVQLIDYNNDGKEDIFTYENGGIKVYKNVSAPGQPPAWEHFLFDTGFGTKSTVLLTKGFSNKVNLQLNFDDLPAISDADGDGVGDGPVPSGAGGGWEGERPGEVMAGARGCGCAHQHVESILARVVGDGGAATCLPGAGPRSGRRGGAVRWARAGRLRVVWSSGRGAGPGP